MLLASISTFASNTVAGRDHFQKEVDEHVFDAFQPAAKSLIEKANVKSVEIINDRLVVTIDTSLQYFDMTVTDSSGDETKNSKRLGSEVKIPFPNNLDIKNCPEACEASNEYMKILSSYGLGTSGIGQYDISNGRLDLLFMSIKSKFYSSFKYEVFIGFSLTPVGSSFDTDNNEINFFRKGFDLHGGWGSGGIKLELKHL